MGVYAQIGYNAPGLKVVNFLERGAISRAASEREGGCQGSKDVEKNSQD